MMVCKKCYDFIFKELDYFIDNVLFIFVSIVFILIMFFFIKDVLFNVLFW